ncbi:MAG: NAD(P)-dependent oxidoreductase [Limnohabitans sp.]|jgi:3-hydroxyisobutyrate dehydrogenase|nr:NAD(P)-dependent oxidoreductase [Limnohabitans sp.]
MQHVNTGTTTSETRPLHELSSTRIGWIGTGIMGGAMAGHLLAAGAPLKVHTRTRARAEALLTAGAAWAATPAEATRDVDVVCVNVSLPEELDAVFFGPDGVSQALRSGQLVIDFGTSRPSDARRIAEAALARGAEALDAPVSGGDVGARNATLSIMVGGNANAFDRALPIFHRLGKTVVRLGESGAGQRTKIVNQMLVATSTIGMCEAVHFAQTAGLDTEKVLAAVGGGAAASWSIATLAPRVLRGDFEPGFSAQNLLKDLRIARDEAHELGLALPVVEHCLRRYESLVATGHGARGTQGLVLLLRAEQQASAGHAKSRG